MKRTEETTAVHEAGHAVAAVLANIPILRVTIVRQANGDHGGVWRKGAREHASHLALCHRWPRATMQAWAERHAVALLAGEAAQRRFSPRSWRRWHSEWDAKSARRYMEPFILSARDVTPSEKAMRERARRLVEEHWREISAVAALLLDRRTVTGREVLRAVRAAVQTRSAK